MQASNPIAATLICSLAFLPCSAETPKPPRTITVKLPAPPKLKQIQGDQRILHALDRLTFGPRPGELEEVRAAGLDAWITQQLHPATIDDFALEERLEKASSEGAQPREKTGSHCGSE